MTDQFGGISLAALGIRTESTTGEPAPGLDGYIYAPTGPQIEAHQAAGGSAEVWSAFDEAWRPFGGWPEGFWASRSARQHGYRLVPVVEHVNALEALRDRRIPVGRVTPIVRISRDSTTGQLRASTGGMLAAVVPVAADDTIAVKPR